MGTWKVKRNDTYPPLVTTLTDADDVAVNLAGASVMFLMRDISNSALTVRAAMSFVTDGSDGQVQYDWDPADTATAGMYIAEYEVTYATGEVQTFPTSGYDRVLIWGDLDADVQSLPASPTGFGHTDLVGVTASQHHAENHALRHHWNGGADPILGTTQVFNVTDPAYGAVADSGSTDNSAAIQAAEDDAEVAGGIVWFPPAAGYYGTVTPIEVNGTKGVTWLGGGASAASTGSVVRNNTDHVINFASSSSVLDFTMRDMGIFAGAAGKHALVIVGTVGKCHFENNILAVRTTTSSALYASGASWILVDVMFLNNKWDADGQAASVPLVLLEDTAGGKCNDNTWFGGRFQGFAGRTAPLIKLSCEHAANWDFSNTVENVNFEIPEGGSVRMEGQAGFRLKHLSHWDFSDTVADLVWIGDGDTGQPCKDYVVDGSMRMAGTLGVGYYDVKVDGGQRGVLRGVGSHSPFNGKMDLNSQNVRVEDFYGDWADIDNTAAMQIIDSFGQRFGPGKGIVISGGSANPEGSVVGSPPDIYLRTSGGAGTTIYVKETGSATNTGWVGK